ncbi:DNA primase large subunit PriL [Candidatus Burarchaeum australiense]|nr:DNA primase large subunit PriL [Candidatus Burarchaeum australiense]
MAFVPFKPTHLRSAPPRLLTFSTHMPFMADVLFCAKYPFTRSARELMAEKKLTLASIGGDAVERAKKRVMGALKEGEIPKFIDMDDVAELELGAYAVSRILLSLVKNRYFINRYAVAESKRASAYLRDDSAENVLRVAGEIGIRGEKENEGYVMPVVDYLLYAPGAKDYKLINKPLRSGAVLLTKREFTRVLEEAVRLGIERALPFSVPEAPGLLTRAADEIRQEGKGLEPKYEAKFEGGDFPPCIASLVERLKMGENLNHTARWALAVFMLNAGVSVDAIVNLYSFAPDFDERITRYQVEHAKARGYKMPTCSWMRSQGIGCEPPCRLSTPLRYKGGKREESPEAAK